MKKHFSKRKKATVSNLSLALCLLSLCINITVMNKMYEDKNEYSFKIGGNVRKWRGVKGIKQNQLASRLNLSAPALSYIENDITIPNLRQVENIARSLEISIDMLLYGPEAILNNYQHSTSKQL